MKKNNNFKTMCQFFSVTEKAAVAKKYVCVLNKNKCVKLQQKVDSRYQLSTI